MDRNFYQQKLAQQHQRDLSRELKTRSLLKEADSNNSSLKWRARVVVPVALTIAVLILLNFLR